MDRIKLRCTVLWSTQRVLGAVDGWWWQMVAEHLDWYSGFPLRAFPNPCKSLHNNRGFHQHSGIAGSSIRYTWLDAGLAPFLIGLGVFIIGQIDTAAFNDYEACSKGFWICSHANLAECFEVHSGSIRKKETHIGVKVNQPLAFDDIPLSYPLSANIKNCPRYRAILVFTPLCNTPRCTTT